MLVGDKFYQSSDQLCHIHWHLIDLNAVILFNVSHYFKILIADKVDGDTFSSKTTTTTDPVYVELSVGWQIIVNDQGNLLYIESPAPKISGDEYSRVALSEFTHDAISFFLVHLAVHAGHCEVILNHFFG